VARRFGGARGAEESARPVGFALERLLVRSERLGGTADLHQQIPFELACGENRPWCDRVLLEGLLQLGGFAREPQRRVVLPPCACDPGLRGEALRLRDVCPVLVTAFTEGGFQASQHGRV